MQVQPQHHQRQNRRCLSRTRALICAAAAFCALQLGGCAVVNEGASAPSAHARVVQRDLGGTEQRPTRNAP
jgi:nitrous oxide reductase